MVREANELDARWQPEVEPVGTDNFGNLLRDPAMAMGALVARELAEHGFGDLRPGLLAVATHIRADGSRVTDVAQRAQVSKPTVVHAVDELGGSATPAASPTPPMAGPSRTLTERALEAECVGREAIARIRDAWAAALGEREMAQLEALLLRLRDAVAYVAKLNCSASTAAIAARQIRWSRRIERASRLWASTGSLRRPRRTADGTVLPPASAIATSASGSEAHAGQLGCRARSARRSRPASPASPPPPAGSWAARGWSRARSRRRSRPAPPRAAPRRGGR